jgi:hypothetical protein
LIQSRFRGNYGQPADPFNGSMLSLQRVRFRHAEIIMWKMGSYVVARRFF